jgi:MoxR-like ATPase
MGMQISLTEEQVHEAHHLLEMALYELKRVVVGQDHLLERLLVATICKGHVLVEGAPGLAKTLALKTLAQAVQLEFKRIQFTPDLLPADLIGTRIYNPGEGSFNTELGPIFANFILADEINRAPAKVQSALLEAMQERQVTIGRETFGLKEPFLVMATQNPIESEGTYTLPEAQLDRFLFKILVNYPNDNEEFIILERVTQQGLPQPQAILTADRVHTLNAHVSQVFLDSALMSYIVRLVQATRHRHNGNLRYGASPRGSISIATAAKGLALMRGRGYVVPQDIQAVLKDTLRHRLILSYEALAQGKTADDLIDELVASVEKPELEGVT